MTKKCGKKIVSLQPNRIKMNYVKRQRCWVYPYDKKKHKNTLKIIRPEIVFPLRLNTTPSPDNNSRVQRAPIIIKTQL
jgi:hypothetical protein